MARVLVVDDDEDVRSFLASALLSAGHEVDLAGDGRAAWQRLKARNFHVVLTDLKMPVMGGLELLRKVRAEQPEVEVIVLTAHGTIDTAVEAMKEGAFEYLQKPVGSPTELRLVVARAAERRALRDRAQEGASSTAPVLTWGAASMTPVVHALERVAPTDATVLLTGDSGTGKEVAARFVHARSKRAAGPFVAVNCASLSETLLESELFGHEKGAFTSADTRHRGKIELAEGGTFFLDEVGELKPSLQAKLLRVLQERTFERVGGTGALVADVRWVAATNRDLTAAMQEGRFREDLYHRLAVFPVHLPRLSERPEDVVPLAERLLADIGRELGRTGLHLAPGVAERLRAAPWPGNVRELRNVLERATILADGPAIDPHLAVSSAVPGRPGGGVPTMEEAEAQLIVSALALYDGHRQKAAEHLQIGLRTLYDKIRKYDL